MWGLELSTFRSTSKACNHYTAVFAVGACVYRSVFIVLLCIDWDTDWQHTVMLVVSNCYIIFGIALLSMCLNLMQEQIIDGVSEWQI